MKCFAVLRPQREALANWTLDVPAWPRVGDILTIGKVMYVVTSIEHDFERDVMSVEKHQNTWVILDNAPGWGPE